jgi:hypothetical protein
VEIKTRVVVYGSSLQMAGIAASLKANPNLEVVCISPRSPNARQSLSELKPAAIAFDLCDPPASVDVTLLRQQPGVLLIGVDPASDEILLLSSRPVQALSVADLVNAIDPRDRSNK